MFGNGQATREFASVDDARKFFRVVEHNVRNLNVLLEPIRRANKVPALGCAVVRSNRIDGPGAVGLRKWDVTNAPVTLYDRWHQGSLTKSMTATLAALMVEKGEIRWDSTLAEVFPDVAPKLHPQWRGPTLEQLTSNRGGAPTDLVPGGVWTELGLFKGTPREGRRLLLELLTARSPNSPPGTRYEYSNAGFSLGGHMLETVAGKAWEDLLTERLFVPLAMTSVGFGPPATPRYINHPWGHNFVAGKTVAIPDGEHPPAIGPSATVHCTVVDLARYAAFQVAGHNEGSTLLTQAGFLKLHTAYPNNENYAHGWLAVDRPWAGSGPALTHAGSNTIWYSVNWLTPARDFAVVAVCNHATVSGANPGATATEAVVGKIIQEFLSN